MPTSRSPIRAPLQERANSYLPEAHSLRTSFPVSDRRRDARPTWLGHPARSLHLLARPKFAPLALLIATLLLLLPSCGLIGLAASVGIAKLQFGCLPEGTLIDTPGGPILIENLKAGNEILGFHGSPVEVMQIHQYREDPATSRYLTVHFANGASVCVSPKHRIDGTPAEALRPGDTCGTTTVTRIDERTGVSRSFDILTHDDPGYSISGIPVNSMILEMLGQTRQTNPRETAKSRN